MVYTTTGIHVELIASYTDAKMIIEIVDTENVARRVDR